MAKTTTNNGESYKGFYPRQDRALIKIDAAVEKTAAGIIIPKFDGEGNNTSMAEKPTRGIVVAKGPLVDDLEIGDHVLYGQHSGFDVPVNGTTYKLIRANDAFAKIETT
jgi:chaperonin GroES